MSDKKENRNKFVGKAGFEGASDDEGSGQTSKQVKWGTALYEETVEQLNATLWWNRNFESNRLMLEELLKVYYEHSEDDLSDVVQQYRKQKK